MISKQSPTNCLCSLWETNPQLLEKQGLPHGYCGICELCGDPGHTRHYPGPVPITGVWCDTCYQVQAHKAPIRTPGVWYFDAETLEEKIIDNDAELNKETLQMKLRNLRTPRSALIIELPTKIGIDFFLKKDGVLDMEFSDHHSGLFGKGDIDLKVAELALSILLEQGDIRRTMSSAGIELEYYEGELDNSS